MNLTLVLGLFVAFAAWLACHALIVVGLWPKAPRWQVVLCLVPPLFVVTPVFGFREGFKGQAAGWTLAILAWGAFLYLGMQ